VRSPLDSDDASHSQKATNLRKTGQEQDGQNHKNTRRMRSMWPCLDAARNTTRPVSKQRLSEGRISLLAQGRMTAEEGLHRANRGWFKHLWTASGWEAAIQRSTASRIDDRRGSDLRLILTASARNKARTKKRNVR
jgi:hypothetical protein